MKSAFGLQLHITDACDQRCKHCYIYNTNTTVVQHELSIEMLKKIAIDFKQFCVEMDKSPAIAVTGGDPLLHKDIWEFLEFLKQEDIRFMILGNPFHLDVEVATRLKQLGCINYQLSLDGLEKTHDYIRKPGSFRETLQKVQCLNEVGLRSTIMTTISKDNIQEIPDLVPIVVKAKVKNFAFARYCPSEKDIGKMVSPAEYREFLEKMWTVFKQFKDSETRFALKDHLWTLFLYEHGLFNIPDDTEIIYDGCNCAISHITVLSDGKVYACRRCDSKIGDIFTQSFQEIFLGDEIEKYRQFESFEACAKCELLRFCRGCPAVAKCATGNFYAKDPQCWKKI